MLARLCQPTPLKAKCGFAPLINISERGSQPAFEMYSVDSVESPGANLHIHAARDDFPFVRPVYAEITMQILSVSADHHARNHNYLNRMHHLRAAVLAVGWNGMSLSPNRENAISTMISMRPTSWRSQPTGKLSAARECCLHLAQRFWSRHSRNGWSAVRSPPCCNDRELRLLRRHVASSGEGGGPIRLLTMFAGIIEWSMANG